MDRSMVKHLVSCLNKPLFGLALGLSLLATGLGLLLPQLIGQLLDAEVLADVLARPSNMVGILLFFLLVYGLRALSAYWVGKSGSQAVNRLQKQLHQQLLSAEVSALEGYAAGDLTSRLTADASVVLRFVTMVVPAAVLHVVVILGSVYFLWQISPTLTMMSLVFLPTIALVIFPLNQRLEESYASYQTGLGHLSGHLGHKCRHSRLIKTFCGEGDEKTQMGVFLDQLMIQFNRIIAWTAVEQTLVNGLVMGGIILLLLVAGRDVVAGRLTMSQLTTFVLYVMQLVEPLAELVQSTADFAEFTGVSKRLRALFDLSTEENRVPVNQPEASIRFDNVRFSYGTDPVLDGVSFQVPAGRHLAIIGPSGCGKSTLFALLLAFYRAQGGRILLGDRDLGQLPVSQIRQWIAHVPQDNSLFQGSLRENLLYGKNRSVSEERLQEVLEALDLLPVIADLEHGLETRLSDSGTGLSEGQKQRFSLARALLQDAPIYLLDEVTASLDQETEAVITRAIDRLTKGKTRLTIAHRLNTLASADDVLVLNQAGQVEAFGSVDQVLKTHQLPAAIAS